MMEVFSVLLLMVCVGLGLGLRRMWQQKEALLNDHDEAKRLRNEAELALQQQRQLQSAVFDALYDGLLIATSPQQQIIAANQKAHNLLGTRLVNETVMTVMRSYDLEALLADAEIMPHENHERVMEVDTHILRVRVCKITSLETPIYILLLRDETELHRLNRARRDMVANISHELRTPITNISLNADTLLSGALKKPKRSIKLVKGIRREVETLTQLVEEMRDLSRIESGQMPVKLMPTPLLPLIQKSVEQLEPLAESKMQRIRLEVSAEIITLADAPQALRVIKNIIHNAIKFAPKDSEISVVAATNEEEVTITVINHGAPIPEAEIPRLFERFYQVDKARGDGTGLGLAIARHIVLSHGGTIWAENLPDRQGVAFHFTLPLSDTVLTAEHE